MGLTESQVKRRAGFLHERQVGNVNTQQALELAREYLPARRFLPPSTPTPTATPTPTKVKEEPAQDTMEMDHSLDLDVLPSERLLEQHQQEERQCVTIQRAEHEVVAIEGGLHLEMVGITDKALYVLFPKWAAALVPTVEFFPHHYRASWNIPRVDVADCMADLKEIPFPSNFLEHCKNIAAGCLGGRQTYTVHVRHEMIHNTDLIQKVVGSKYVGYRVPLAHVRYLMSKTIGLLLARYLLFTIDALIKVVAPNVCTP
jgi:hypothetical protein